MVGDRCAWLSLNGKMETATVRWIGFLRGQAVVYAGLEFDAAVGQGNGVYQGVILFETRMGHAGGNRAFIGKRWFSISAFTLRFSDALRTCSRS
ncbi:hypothetical protein PMAYCL1PPCAC_08027, partial [Pristionchus mayeri]